jgi:hypothetical protein
MNVSVLCHCSGIRLAVVRRSRDSPAILPRMVRRRRVVCFMVAAGDAGSYRLPRLLLHTIADVPVTHRACKASVCIPSHCPIAALLSWPSTSLSPCVEATSSLAARLASLRYWARSMIRSLTQHSRCANAQGPLFWPAAYPPLEWEGLQTLSTSRLTAE